MQINAEKAATTAYLRDRCLCYTVSKLLRSSVIIKDLSVRELQIFPIMLKCMNKLMKTKPQISACLHN